MSYEATIEIKKFDGRRDMRSEITSFYLGDSSTFSPAMSGKRDISKKFSVHFSGIDAEHFAVYSNQNPTKIYPEIIIKGKFSSGTNGTNQRAIFTFNQVTINYYRIDSDGRNKSIYAFDMEFEKFSYDLDARAGVLK